MTGAHIHLLLNHLPVFGSILGAIVLFYGMFSNTYQTKIAAYLVLIISAIGAIIAYSTGESAEEAVENIPGVAKDLIEQHEHFALYSLISFILIGALSLFALFITLTQSIYMRPMAVVIMVISLISFLLIIRTANLGGKIRHTELSGSTVQGQGQEQGGEEKDDD